MSARQKLARSKLTERSLAQEMARVLPRRNNYAETNHAELLSELGRFGIATRGALRKLLLRHRKQLMRIDREPLDACHIGIFSEDHGAAVVKDHLRRQLWFAWEGLVRVALELEFGEAYEAFSRERDGI